MKSLKEKISTSNSKAQTKPIIQTKSKDPREIYRNFLNLKKLLGKLCVLIIKVMKAVIMLRL